MLLTCSYMTSLTTCHSGMTLSWIPPDGQAGTAHVPIFINDKFSILQPRSLLGESHIFRLGPIVFSNELFFGTGVVGFQSVPNCFYHQEEIVCSSTCFTSILAEILMPLIFSEKRSSSQRRSYLRESNVFGFSQFG